MLYFEVSEKKELFYKQPMESIYRYSCLLNLSFCKIAIINFKTKFLENCKEYSVLSNKINSIKCIFARFWSWMDLEPILHFTTKRKVIQ